MRLLYASLPDRKGRRAGSPWMERRAVVGILEVPRKPDSNPALGRWVGWWAGAAGERWHLALGPRAFAVFSKELEGEGGVLSCCCMGLFVRKGKMLAGEPAVGTE